MCILHDLLIAIAWFRAAMAQIAVEQATTAAYISAPQAWAASFHKVCMQVSLHLRQQLI